MKEFIEKLIGRLEEKKKHNDEIHKDITNLGIIQAIAIVNQLAEEYKYCNKPSCEDCEVYDTEKHYCPKWCEVIKGTFAEMEENHNGWIPCSERLPEDNRTYEVTEDYAGVIFTNFASYDSVNKIWWTNDEDGFSDVLAWRERSAPYQPKGE